MERIDLATYEVPEQNMGWLWEKVEKPNKKAEKLGVVPVTIRVPPKVD